METDLPLSLEKEAKPDLARVQEDLGQPLASEILCSLYISRYQGCFDTQKGDCFCVCASDVFSLVIQPVVCPHIIYPVS